MALYNKTKLSNYNVGDLQAEINESLLIIPSCVGITGSSDNLSLEFASTLTTEEEAELDNIILAHVPSPQTINAESLTFSTMDNKKLSVHPSYKPYVSGKTTYAVWTGSGDDMDTAGIGEGELIHFLNTPGTPSVSKDIKFHPDNGRVWIHEGYLKFENGGFGDYLEADVVAEATPLQQAVSLDLVVADNWVSYSPGGPGTGTHGFADPAKIVLIPRTFSKDGDWDYDGTSLTPNMSGTGGYKISDLERTVHRYINKIPCYGTCQTYFSMSSDETSEILANYFLRITTHNISNSSWNASILMEIYRERTHNP